MYLLHNLCYTSLITIFFFVDNLNDAAVVDQFKSSLADFSERRADW